MMRLSQAVLLVIASAGLSGCTVSWSNQSAPSRWTAGFWFWQGSSIDPAYSGQELDVLFVQVGTIRKETMPGYLRTAGNAAEQWYAYGELPSEIPPAREYWLVYRYANQGVPDLQVASKLATQISRLQADARQRHLNVVGLQLDIDSPTSALPQYAGFIRQVRMALPKGVQVSITALLDWFRSGTAVGDVIAQADEFVPQFYDLGDPAADDQAAIAARIDAARWEPVFNRFRKRFRIGISSFGRARVIPHEPPSQSPYRRLVFYGDLRPLDVATNPAFQLQTSRNAADETVLGYRAIRKVHVGYERIDAGDVVQFVISTPDAIRAAVQSARLIHGQMAGIVFFRWPSSREDWAMQPDEVLEAAGVAAAAGGRQRNRIQVMPGDCAAVSCVDVYLDSAGPLVPQPVRYRIRASVPLEYFLPERNMPVHLTGASELELSLPPYCSRGHLYLGRAVSLQRAEFTVGEEQ
ncbi:MAG: DUF3142 domain-containing protein [Acidobacteria bacterium]|nr:DUF3142 domain-containing protein [Acidobacteriota bacterium]